MTSPSPLKLISFSQGELRLSVPHYHLLGALLQGAHPLMIRFEGFRVVVHGRNMALLFELFAQRTLWHLRTGIPVKSQSVQPPADPLFFIEKISFHGTDLDGDAEGQVMVAGVSQEAEGDPLAGSLPALICFEQRAQACKLALPHANLLQAAAFPTKVILLFERWRVTLRGERLGPLLEAICAGRVTRLVEGETALDSSRQELGRVKEVHLENVTD